MTVISFRPELENLQFLQSVKIPKTQILNSALDVYRKYLLRKEIREWFSLQSEQDLQLCNADFEDYISLIKKENEL